MMTTPAGLDEVIIIQTYSNQGRISYVAGWNIPELAV
jgi:hypothetical protein